MPKYTSMIWQYILNVDVYFVGSALRIQWNNLSRVLVNKKSVLRRKSFSLEKWLTMITLKENEDHSRKWPEGSSVHLTSCSSCYLSDCLKHYPGFWFNRLFSFSSWILNSLRSSQDASLTFCSLFVQTLWLCQSTCSACLMHCLPWSHEVNPVVHDSLGETCFGSTVLNSRLKKSQMTVGWQGWWGRWSERRRRIHWRWRRRWNNNRWRDKRNSKNKWQFLSVKWGHSGRCTGTWKGWW